MRGEFCLHLGFGLQHRPLPRGRVRIPTFAASDRVADVCAKYAAHAGSDDDADSSADSVAVGAPDTGAVVFTDGTAFVSSLGLANQRSVIGTIATAEPRALCLTDGIALSWAHILTHGAPDVQSDSIADAYPDGAAHECTHASADGPADGPSNGSSVGNADVLTHNPADGLAHGAAHSEPDGRTLGFAHGASDHRANGHALGRTHVCSIGIAHSQSDGYANGHADGRSDRRTNSIAYG